jgi:hypothetical protein
MTYWQEPSTHPVPSGHWVPQVPQLVLLFDVSAQVPAQLSVPVGQVHWLFWQIRLPPHDSKQSPQFCLFEVRSTHEAPHCDSPAAAHRTAHVPALQMGAEGGHRLPHAPQFALLDVRSTQTPSPMRPTVHWV